jgi:hypothetical protein
MPASLISTQLWSLHVIDDWVSWTEQILINNALSSLSNVLCCSESKESFDQLKNYHHEKME